MNPIGTKSHEVLRRQTEQTLEDKREHVQPALAERSMQEFDP